MFLSAIFVLLAAPVVGAEDTRPWEGLEFPPALRARLFNSASCGARAPTRQACLNAARRASVLNGHLLPDRLGVDLASWLLNTPAPTTMPAAYYWTQITNAYLRTFDPDAQILPETAIAARESGALEGYVGAGIDLRPSAEGWIVAHVNPDSPAARLGVLADDVLLGLAPDGFALEESRDRILADIQSRSRGPVGQPLAVRVRRGESVITFRFDRAHIPIAGPTAAALDLFAPASLLRVRSFQSLGTCSELSTLIEQERARGARHLVLDLRRNAGGELAMALCAAGLFVGERPVLGLVSAPYWLPPFTRSIRKADQTPLWLEGTMRAQTEAPLAILIDARTASAAEFVAGSLQELGRALVIGQRSAGKNSLQSRTWVSSGENRFALQATKAIFVYPSGRTAHGQGLDPDLRVAAPEPIARLGDTYNGAHARNWPATMHARGLAPSPEVERIQACVTPDRLAEARARSGSLDDAELTALIALECQSRLGVTIRPRRP